MEIHRRKDPRPHEDITRNASFPDNVSFQSMIITTSMGGVKRHDNTGHIPEIARRCRILIEAPPVAVTASVHGEVIRVDGDKTGIQCR